MCGPPDLPSKFCGVQTSPLPWSIEIDQGNGEIWKPENFEGKSGGPHTLRYGVEHSINQMTVRLARDIGMPLIAEYAKRFGIYDNLPLYLAMSRARRTVIWLIECSTP